MTEDRNGESPEDRAPSGLDPAADPAAWERRVEAIVSAAEPVLRRRAAGDTAVDLQIERWARPVLAAAAAVIVAGTGLLVASGGPAPEGGSPLADVSADDGQTLVSPVVDPWLERDTITVGAVEEMVTVNAWPPGDRR